MKPQNSLSLSLSLSLPLSMLTEKIMSINVYKNTTIVLQLSDVTTTWVVENVELTIYKKNTPSMKEFRLDQIKKEPHRSLKSILHIKLLLMKTRCP